MGHVIDTIAWHLTSLMAHKLFNSVCPGGVISRRCGSARSKEMHIQADLACMKQKRRDKEPLDPFEQVHGSSAN